MGDAIKMKLETKDMAAENVQKIAALFPNCVTEKETADGRLEKAINWKMLKQMLKGKVIDGEEAYEFTWVGKKAAIVEANKPIRKTLRPCKEESKNWDTTENLYIEGDNLEALKLLQESYLGKVKVIYIDPPYNTGNDYIYNDDFKQDFSEYEEESGAIGEDGNRMTVNHDTDGRFHSKWCSMIYSRLLIARNLLSNDGAVFISIDTKEEENLKKIGDEIFGASNFVETVVWQHSIQPKGYLGKFSIQHSYLMIWCKNKDVFKLGNLERTEEDNKAYSNPDNDPNGPWRSGDVRNALYRPNLIYDIVAPNGNVIKPCDNGWRWSKETIKEKMESGEIIFNKEQTRIIRKIYLSNLEGRAPETIWYGKDVGTTREGISELKNLFGEAPFDTPKPTGLVDRILQLMNDKEMIVLDFFGGSSTTSDAVMQFNKRTAAKCKFILIQLPESLSENKIAKKNGYKNICEIGKERIRRAGDKIVADNADKEGIADLDIGFRVLKVDSSNMNDVYYGAEDYSQQLLLQMEDNIKSDRTELDLLFGCIVDWGLELSCPYASTEIEGYTVHDYNDGDLVACFAENIPESVIKAIAKMEPMRAVFRDSGFADSPAKINVTEIFKRLSPDTDVRVI